MTTPARDAGTPTVEARELAASASKGPAAVGIFDPEADPVENFREHLSFGSGDVWCVWLPEHPRTKGEHPRPDHAVLACITGNGPTSEQNARFFAWCLTNKGSIPLPASPRREDVEAAMRSLEDAVSDARVMGRLWTKELAIARAELLALTVPNEGE